VLRKSVQGALQALPPMKSHDLAFVLEAEAVKPEMTSKIGLELSKSSFRKARGADDLTSK